MTLFLSELAIIQTQRKSLDSIPSATYVAEYFLLHNIPSGPNSHCYARSVGPRCYRAPLNKKSGCLTHGKCAWPYCEYMRTGFVLRQAAERHVNRQRGAAQVDDADADVIATVGRSSINK